MMSKHKKRKSKHMRNRHSKNTSSESDEDNWRRKKFKLKKIEKILHRLGFLSLSHLSIIDYMNILLITILSFVIRLTNINLPGNATTIEDYYLKAVKAYYGRNNFIPHNPPFPILLFLYISNNQYYIIDGIDEDYYDFSNFRLLSGICSSLCPLIIYLTTNYMGLSCFASFTTSIILCFETIFITAGRNASSNGIIQLYTSLTFLFISFLPKIKDKSIIWYIIIILQSLCTSICISSDNSAISILIFVLIYYLSHDNNTYPIIINLIMSISFYFVVFYKHTSIFISEDIMYELMISRYHKKSILSISSKQIINTISETIQTIIQSLNMSFSYFNIARKIPLSQIISSQNGIDIILMCNKANGIWVFFGIIFSMIHILYNHSALPPNSMIFLFGFEISFIFSVLFGESNPTLITIPYIFAIIISVGIVDSSFPTVVRNILFSVIIIISIFYFFLHFSDVLGYNFSLESIVSSLK